MNDKSKTNKHYMNPHTGSVDTWDNWCQDQKEMGDDAFPLSDLDILIEVELIDGEWVEVKE